MVDPGNRLIRVLERLPHCKCQGLHVQGRSQVNWVLLHLFMVQPNVQYQLYRCQRYSRPSIHAVIHECWCRSLLSPPILCISSITHKRQLKSLCLVEWTDGDVGGSKLQFNVLDS